MDALLASPRVASVLASVRRSALFTGLVAVSRWRPTARRAPRHPMTWRPAAACLLLF